MQTSQTKTASLWQNPEFMKLWGGQTISELGSTITRDALPLLAVITLGATPFQMGLLSSSSGLAALLFGLVAGVWVDRRRRRPILIGSALLQAVLLAGLPLAAVSGVLSMGLVYLVTVSTGVLSIFFSVAYRSYLPSLVERQNLLEGNSKLALSDSIAEIGGAGLAGVLVQVMTAPFAVLLDSFSFVVSALAIGSIRKAEPEPEQPAATASFRQEAGEGLRSIAHNPILRALAGSEAALAFFGSFIGVLYSLYAIRILNMGPAALGFTIAVGGLGSLLGSLLSPPAVRRFGLGGTLTGALLLGIGAHLLIPLASGSMALIFTCMVAAQLFGDALRTIFFINAISLRQAVTPDRLLGRTNAGIEMLSAAAAPLGALVGGLLGDLLGVRATLVVAACGGGLLAAVLLWLSPVGRLRALPAPAGETE
ncbi:MAG: MFS transporter [Chloroflexi bacterium]|nr:MFS transporter [Chloroflexota bacterium]